MEYDKNEIELIERYFLTLYLISPAKIFLRESHGVYDPLVPITEEVLRQILSTIQPIVEEQHSFAGSIKIDKSNMDDPFFDSLTVNFGYLEERVPIADLSAQYSQAQSKITKDEANVVINIFSHAQDNLFVEKLRSAIIHELAHAYDDYIETKNSKYDKSYARYESEAIIDRAELSYHLTKSHTIEGKLAAIISFILKSEKEAEQTEFLSDVMRLSKMRIYTDPRNLTPYVSNTPFYQNMMRIKEYLKEIENLQNDEDKINVTQVFNKIYREKGMSYEQMCVFLRKRWNFRKNELFKHVTKRIFDMVESFVENPIDSGRFMASLYENYGAW